MGTDPIAAGLNPLQKACDSRAAYATLLFPIVALGISTVREDYQWTPEAAAGVALILAGNLLMLKKKKKRIDAQVESLPVGPRALGRIRA